jgi:hypothetical protein
MSDVNTKKGSCQERFDGRGRTDPQTLWCGGKTAVGVAVERKNFVGKVERETGIEPATSSLGSSRSTAELLPRYG